MKQLVHANVIPDGWVEKPLFDMCRFIPGKAHEPFIDPLGEFTCVNSKFISTEGQVAKTCNRSITPARANDILMVMSDLPNGRALAKCYLVSEHERLAVNQRVCILRPKQGFDAQMLFHILNRHPYFMAFDDGVNQTHLLNGVFEKCTLAVPDDFEEQANLGQALSDADGVVEGLERLIEKKRRIKQGAMQDLLTAKRRLPGFSGEWVERKLGTLCKVSRGASPRPIANTRWFDNHSSIGWVRISDLPKSGRFLTNTTQRLSPDGIARSRRVPIGSLIMSIAATVGRPAITTIDACIHDGFVVFTDLGIDQLFLFYLLKTMEPQWSLHGQTGSQMNINTGIIELAEVYVPESTDEQHAIAQVFAAIDGELNALENRLQKARAIKEGMMQNLLTGRIRLV